MEPTMKYEAQHVSWWAVVGGAYKIEEKKKK